MSVPGLSDAEGWALLSTNPLAYIEELARAHHENLQEGGEVAVLALNGCPTCTGALIYEVSNPLSARCMACGEPVRRNR